MSDQKSFADTYVAFARGEATADDMKAALDRLDKSITAPRKRIKREGQNIMDWLAETTAADREVQILEARERLESLESDLTASRQMVWSASNVRQNALKDLNGALTTQADKENWTRHQLDCETKKNRAEMTLVEFEAQQTIAQIRLGQVHAQSVLLNFLLLPFQRAYVESLETKENA